MLDPCAPPPPVPPLRFASVVAQNAVLLYQLHLLAERPAHARFTPIRRATIVLFSRIFPERRWRRFLHIVQPETILRWHRAGWRLFWRWKSRPGRHTISSSHIAFIRRISSDHPEWGVCRARRANFAVADRSQLAKRDAR